jgi:hypothetical protein
MARLAGRGKDKCPWPDAAGHRSLPSRLLNRNFPGLQIATVGDWQCSLPLAAKRGPGYACQMDTIESIIEEWERRFGPAAYRKSLMEAMRAAAKASPNDSATAKWLDVELRRVEPGLLGDIWREWGAAGRPDLRLRVEQELERRKRNNSLTR